MSIRGIAAVAVGLLLLAVPLAAAATQPVLRITRDAPLTLRGSGFRPQEAVKLTVTNGDHEWRKAARAGLSGTFVARWSAAIRLNYCAIPVAVTARGASSGTVSARIPVRECAAP
jgi:hypothetical protein